MNKINDTEYASFILQLPISLYIVCVRVDKLFVPKKEITTKSLADNIEDTQKAVINDFFSLGKSIVRNLLNPYRFKLFAISSFSFTTRKNEGAKQLYVNGKTKKEFRIITIIIFGRYIKFNLNNNMQYPTAITAGEKIIKL